MRPRLRYRDFALWQIFCNFVFIRLMPFMETPIKRSVLDYNDIVELVPRLKGHEKLVNRVLHLLSVDKVNAVHDKYCDNPGPEFARNLLKDFDITLDVDGLSLIHI